MGKFKYSEDEQKIVNVLKYQDIQLNEMLADKNNNKAKTEAEIEVLESLLRKMGKDPSKLQIKSSVSTVKQKYIVVPSWDQLCKEAESVVGGNCELESIFTQEELNSNTEYINRLQKEFNQIHNLDKIDIAIAAIAGIIAGAVDILLVGIPQRSKDGLKGGALSNYIRDYFDKILPPEEMEKLANSKESKVPFDAQDNRNTNIRVEGLSAYYHRLLQLGHDPILGFIVGVMDIMTGKMTTIDKTGKFVSQAMENYAERVEPDIFKAFAKELAHLKSDITTSMGLPAPLMSLFNLLQFGSIGEEELTIAEIVQGMYYEGYDFIQFCSSSVPVMLIEVIVRLSYAIKRIKEGHSLKESIPFSLNRDKNPKLATMLFIAHSAATGINAGKVYFTQNPVAINYPQWIAFSKYSYKQLKWTLINKPQAREKYISGILNSELDSVLSEIDASFDEFTKDAIVLFK